MALTKTSRKYWSPVQTVVDWLVNTHIPKDARVLEIGPGHAPFKRADVSVDFVDVKDVPNLIKCDVANEPLPFKDKEFDFCYARHVIEDMYSPFQLLREMSRVAKSGYVECPSPMAELCRGIDGGCPPFRGYHHHRFIGWTFGKELRLVSKYPLVEYLKFDEAAIDNVMLEERYWNTYHLWQDEIQVNHRQSPLNFDIPTQYGMLLNEAMERSKQAIDSFWADITKGKS